MQQNQCLEIRHKMVVKANELIQKSRFNLTLQQQKIVLYLIAQINPFDEDFKLYKFRIVDFCRVCGIDQSNGKNYRDLKQAIKDIADKSLWVEINGVETLLRWIEKPYICKEDGTIRIRLDKDMKPFLLQLKQNFTQYELLWTLRFKSKYATRLYELIKSIHYNELTDYTREYTLDEIRKLLGAENYKTYQSLKSRVLVPAVEEINKYSDKNITYRPLKQGRSVAKISFSISSKNIVERLKLQDETEKELGLDQLTLWDELESKGMV